MHLTIIAISCLMQLAALGVAVYLGSVTKWYKSWAVISFALFLMAIRRFVSFYNVLGFEHSLHLEVAAEITALLVSLALLMGLLLVTPFFIAIRNAHEENQQAHDLIAKSPAVFFVWRAEPDWPVEYVSSNIERLGYSREDLLSGRVTYSSLVHPDDLERVSREVEKYSANKAKSFQQEYRILAADKKIHWVDDRTSIRYDPQGNITHYEGVIIDITEVKAARQSADEMGSIVNDLLNEIYIVDARSLNFLSVNVGALQNLQYNLEELLDMSLADINPLMDEDAYRRKLTPLKLSAKEKLVFETLHVRKDGSTYPVEIHVREIQYQGRTAYLENVIDISFRKQAIERLYKTDRALQAMLEINQAIIFSESESKLLEASCKSLVKTGGYKLAWIGFAEHDDYKSVTPAAQYGFDEGYIESLQLSWDDIPKGRGPTGRAIREKQPVIARDIHTEPHYEPWRAAAEEHGFSSSIAIPMITGGETLGAINIYDGDANAFDAEEVKLLTELATDIAYGIKSRRVEQNREELSSQLESSLISGITTIATLAEKRDPYTSGHMSRVAQLAVALGKKLGMDEHQLEGIRLGASIHDIGKIYVPAEILNRPGKLTEDEFAIIKTHPQVGYDVIKDIDFPWPIADMVLYHHERLDGSGYPKGFKGAEIPIEAQLLAVADVVEAVSSHRPYRPSCGTNKALEIIRSQSGTKLNSEIVEACIDLIENEGFDFESDS